MDAGERTVVMATTIVLYPKSKFTFFKFNQGQPGQPGPPGGVYGMLF